MEDDMVSIEMWPISVKNTPIFLHFVKLHSSRQGDKDIKVRSMQAIILTGLIDDVHVEKIISIFNNIGCVGIIIGCYNLASKEIPKSILVSICYRISEMLIRKQNMIQKDSCIQELKTQLAASLLS
jgi:hypothetical protein